MEIIISAVEIACADAAQQRGRGQMYIEELRRAVMATPRERLAEIQAALWKSHAAGAIGDDDAQGLAELIEKRKVAPPPPSRRNCGSMPLTSESIRRRRRTAAAGWIPPKIAEEFTSSEAAALSVVASRWALTGRCDMTMKEIAGRVGCCITVVQNALREAAKLGLVMIELRRVSYSRNLSNVVKIMSPEWRLWLRNRGTKRDAEGGFVFVPTTQQPRLLTPSRSAQTAKTGPWRQAGKREIDAGRGVRSVEARRSGAS